MRTNKLIIILLRFIIICIALLILQSKGLIHPWELHEVMMIGATLGLLSFFPREGKPWSHYQEYLKSEIWRILSNICKSAYYTALLVLILKLIISVSYWWQHSVMGYQIIILLAPLILFPILAQIITTIERGQEDRREAFILGLAMAIFWLIQNGVTSNYIVLTYILRFSLFWAVLYAFSIVHSNRWSTQPLEWFVFPIIALFFIKFCDSLSLSPSSKEWASLSIPFLTWAVTAALAFCAAIAPYRDLRAGFQEASQSIIDMGLGAFFVPVLVLITFALFKGNWSISIGLIISVSGAVLLSYLIAYYCVRLTQRLRSEINPTIAHFRIKRRLPNMAFLFALILFSALVAYLSMPSSETLENRPIIRWTADFDDIRLWYSDRTATPICTEHLVLVAGQKHSLFAFDINTGKELWQFSTKHPIVGVPLIRNGIAFFSSKDTFLYAVQVKAGTHRWAFETQGEIVTTPYWYKGRLYVGSNDRHVYAVNPITGTSLWKANIGDSMFASLTSDGNNIIVVTMSGKIVALDITTGAQRWTKELHCKVYSTPVYYKGLLLIATKDDKLMILNVRDGSSLKSHILPSNPKPIFSPAIAGDAFYGGPVLEGDVLYLSTYSGSVIALSLPSLNPLWINHTHGTIRAAPTVSSRYVLTTSSDGYLYSFHKDSGVPYWRFPLSIGVFTLKSLHVRGVYWSSASICGESVYLVTTNGALAALSAKSYPVFTLIDFGDNLRTRLRLTMQYLVGNRQTLIECLLFGTFLLMLLSQVVAIIYFRFIVGVKDLTQIDTTSSLIWRSLKVFNALIAFLIVSVCNVVLIMIAQNYWWLWIFVVSPIAFIGIFKTFMNLLIPTLIPIEKKRSIFTEAPRTTIYHPIMRKAFGILCLVTLCVISVQGVLNAHRNDPYWDLPSKVSQHFLRVRSLTKQKYYFKAYQELLKLENEPSLAWDYRYYILKHSYIALASKESPIKENPLIEHLRRLPTMFLGQIMALRAMILWKIHGYIFPKILIGVLIFGFLYSVDLFKWIYRVRPNIKAYNYFNIRLVSTAVITVLLQRVYVSFYSYLISFLNK